jgi:hypothetical protein
MNVLTWIGLGVVAGLCYASGFALPGLVLTAGACYAVLNDGDED